MMTELELNGLEEVHEPSNVQQTLAQRNDGERIVMGRGQYLDDVVDPDALYVTCLTATTRTLSYTQSPSRARSWRTHSGPCLPGWRPKT